MAHPEQQNYIRKVRSLLPEHFESVSVLDVGSCDINGNNRGWFTPKSYTGIDVYPGRNVDVVTPVHLYETEETFDVVISTECLEHDMHYKESLQKMVELTSPGGLFVFTCATTGRPEHGTLRSKSADSLTVNLEGDWANYYKNLTEEDIREVLDIDAIFSKYEFSTNPFVHDLYFWGIKNG